MPKLREPISVVKDRELAALIVMRKRIKQVTYPEIAKQLGCHVNTLFNHIKHPEDFTLGQLRKLFDYLNFSTEERNSVLSKEKYL